VTGKEVTDRKRGDNRKRGDRQDDHL